MKLGLVAVGRRNIRSGYEFDSLFPKAEMVNKIIVPDGNVKDTVKLMAKIVRETLVDTKQIAKKLEVPGDIYATCRNIFDFVYNNIQYRLDEPGEEQLRRPSRAWADRKSGVDCDCYSITISSILTNLNITHSFRITAYEGTWQHVYVVVPYRGSLIKIDPVLDKFDYEKPFSKNFDYLMTKLNGLGLPIAYLGGPDSSADSETIASAQHNQLLGIVNGDAFNLNAIDGLGEAAKPILDQMLNYLKTTRDYISANQASVLAVGGAKAHLTMLNYAIDNWNTSKRDSVLALLADEEARWNRSQKDIPGVDGITVELEQDLSDPEFGDLGKLKLGGKGKQFFSNIKKSVQAVDKINKTIVAKVAGQKAVDKIEQMQAKAKEVAQKVGAAIKKFVVLSNPLTLAMRAGFLAAMKVNLFGMAQRLLPGLLTQAQAEKAGIPVALWERSKKGIEKVGRVFEVIGGARSKLEKHILHGRARKKYKGISGLGSLEDIGALSGEPYSTAAVVIAAAASLLTAGAKMKESGVNKRDYEQLKKEEAARSSQKTTSKKSVKGFGEVDEEFPNEPSDETAVAEEEQMEVAEDGSVDESKKGLSKFIEAIKKFFSRKNKSADIDASEIITEEENSTPTPTAPEGVTKAYDVAQQLKAEAERLSVDASASQEAKDAANTAASKAMEQYENSKRDATESEGGGFMQVLQENMGKVLIGAAVVTTGVVALVYFNKNKKKSKAALAGHRKHKKRKALAGPQKSTKKSKKKSIKVIRLK